MLRVKGVMMKAEDDFMVVVSGSSLTMMVSLGKMASEGASEQPPEELIKALNQ